MPGPDSMRIRVGYEIIYDCPQPTPMVLMLNIHHTRAGDIVVPDRMMTEPFVPVTPATATGSATGAVESSRRRDGCGSRPTAIAERHGPARPDRDVGAAARGRGPARGVARLSARQPILRDRSADGHRVGPVRPVAAPAPDACRRSATTSIATSRSTTRTPDRREPRCEAFEEGKGVCRDYAHLAIAFCRCMNIPARYCTGYLGDIGIPPPYGPMDFAAWFEAYIGGRWHTFDARNNVPRIGRVLMARGRDATDVAISNTFGPNTLAGFKVWADEVRRPTSRRHGPPDRPARHDLPLRRTGAVRRASHDVPAAREPRPAPDQHAARHPAASVGAALAARRLRQLGRHRHL